MSDSKVAVPEPFEGVYGEALKRKRVKLLESIAAQKKELRKLNSLEKRMETPAHLRRFLDMESDELMEEYARALESAAFIKEHIRKMAPSVFALKFPCTCVRGQRCSNHDPNELGIY
jgi:hypothetical protein